MPLIASQIANGDIQGPYSPWPRRTAWRFKRPAIATTSVAALAVFLHCGLPMIA